MTQDRLIANLETGLGVKVRVSYSDRDSKYHVRRWSRSLNQWLAVESFEQFDEAMACVDDQCYEAAETLAPHAPKDSCTGCMIVGTEEPWEMAPLPDCPVHQGFPMRKEDYQNRFSAPTRPVGGANENG